ncbi:hypothetical protein FB550_10415 [Neobacillus bataviensis]|uniref:Uncharacterized protein n=1 Tax=Neobacillus bataviensis TaxID=220685 RepID=A0A561DGI3_9BACI|nr:hypothetical protein FB550_10415 [Neobacillus bataviensis]
MGYEGYHLVEEEKIGGKITMPLHTIFLSLIFKLKKTNKNTNS